MRCSECGERQALFLHEYEPPHTEVGQMHGWTRQVRASNHYGAVVDYECLKCDSRFRHETWPLSDEELERYHYVP